MNKVVLMGRLTSDPILRQTQSNLSVTSFTLAVNRRGKDAGTDFIDIVCWRNTADFVAKYFKKGQQVYVCGTLQSRTWQDTNGNNRKAYEVIADEVGFAESKREDAPAQNKPVDVPEVEETDDFLLLENENDIPFN